MNDGKVRMIGRWSLLMWGPVVMVVCSRGPVPRQRSSVEALPVAGSIWVGRSGGVRMENEALSARKSAWEYPEVFY